MSRLLTRLTPGLSKSTAGASAANLEAGSTTEMAGLPPTSTAHPSANGTEKLIAKEGSSSEVLNQLKAVLADIEGLKPDEIKDSEELADIGIDSLMGVVMAREIESTFNCTLDPDELILVNDLPSLLRRLQSALGIVDDGNAANGTNSDSDDSISTPAGEVLTSSGTIQTPTSSSATSSDPGDLKAEQGVPQSQGSSTLPATIIDVFRESKPRTDHFIQDHRCSEYLDQVMQKQTVLCVALIVEAFRDLGCNLALVSPGQNLDRIPHRPGQR